MIHLEGLLVCLQLINTILASMAIMVGGCWTYKLFIQHREKYPRANVQQEMIHFRLPDGLYLLHVSLSITNISDVLMELESIEMRALQVLPLDDKIKAEIQGISDLCEEIPADINWPKLDCKYINIPKAGCEIEPGETDFYHFDFIVHGKISVVQIYSHVANTTKKKRDIGWTCTDFYQFDSFLVEK